MGTDIEELKKLWKKVNGIRRTVKRRSESCMKKCILALRMRRIPKVIAII